MLIDGKVHSEWLQYSIDSDLLTAADAWNVNLARPLDQTLPSGVTPGANVRVMVGTDVVLVGVVDSIRKRTSKRERGMWLSGRDMAGMLRDSSAPIFTAKQATLMDVINNIVKPFGVTKITISSVTSPSTWDKITIDPGTSAWEALVYAAEGEGLWPWFEPDGTLVIGGPDYTIPPVATLILREKGTGNNVEFFDVNDSIAERYSEVTVLGQAHGRQSEQGKHAMKVTVKDSTMTIYRPRVHVDHDAPTLAAVEARARKILSDSRMNAFTLFAEVKGHRMDDGTLWKPGQRIHVIWEEEGINSVYFLMGREFRSSRQDGQRTRLTLKEDRMWILDAHPHDGKHRKRAASGPLSIITTFASGDTSVAATK
ncbi:phage baseplate assembly protein [Robbsia andropogonis]|uniref:phage baseplate assembly protein n=1 Tax=Robbsia andropogonis TaxID=28092 RepID=UPI003D19989F